MALVSKNTWGEKPERDEHAGIVAGLIREAEMAVANPRITQDERLARLAAIRGQVEHYGGDTSLLPDAGVTAAEKRATRSSKTAQARTKRGPGRPRKADG